VFSAMTRSIFVSYFIGADRQIGNFGTAGYRDRSVPFTLSAAPPCESEYTENGKLTCRLCEQVRRVKPIIYKIGLYNNATKYQRHRLAAFSCSTL